MPANLGLVATYFLRPVQIFQHYSPKYLKYDLLAGITVASVSLPQAIAFALIAGLPPQMGLYATIIATVVAALWGSSNQLQTGPTNAASLLVLSILLPLAEPGSPRFIAGVGMLAVMSGLIRVVMGLARLGILVNFVSDSVIVGFTAGAGLLIAIGELKHLFRLTMPPSTSIFQTIENIVLGFPQTHPLSLALGLSTLIFMLLLRNFAARLPIHLLGIAASAMAVAMLGLDDRGVKILGQIPQGLPPLARLPLFDLKMIGDLSTGALVVAALGLVEATSIARSISSQTGQRLNSNQEFIGQGLANILCGFFSGYPVSGSFNRSALNYATNAKTPIASVLCGLFVLVGMLLLAPFIAYIPRAALSAVLLMSAYGMIDKNEMMRIWRGTRGDTIIMMATLSATIFLPLEFAILTGILFSFARYAFDTSLPQVKVVLPDDEFNHLVHRPDRPCCPQLGIIDIMGELYFGAVSHVEEALRANSLKHPEQRFLLLRMRSVNHCDINGVHMLELVMRGYRERGGDMYLMRVTEPVLEFMKSTHFYTILGEDHFLSDDGAVSYLFDHILDPAICIYECEVRAFKECQNLPKQIYPITIPLHTTIPAHSVPAIGPRELRKLLTDVTSAPIVVDVREPREYKKGHIPQSILMPLSHLLVESLDWLSDEPVVFVCRSGRRSLRAAYIARQQGHNALILAGGIQSWENAGFLEAVEA